MCYFLNVQIQGQRVNPLFILMYLKDLSHTLNSLIILVSLYTALKATTFKTALMMCLPN